MGFPLELCASADDNHLAEYICVVCTSLAESPVLTDCQHVFCSACLEQWVGRTQHRCPTCSATLGAPRPLQQASPLAWRVLGRVRVSCPLKGCEWRGEYSEVSSHLTGSESHLLEAASGMREQAELKAEARMFKEAITLYSKALAGTKDAITLIGRGRAWLQLDQPTQAAADAREALALDSSCSPAHSLLARALVQLGEFDAAARALSSVAVPALCDTDLRRT
jgi:DnaJ family protein C protein 7